MDRALADIASRLHGATHWPPQLVGVFPVPEKPHRILVFRVFDVGPYRGRGKTVGIVAVELAGRGKHGSCPSQVLAALPAPKPGDMEYKLPVAFADELPEELRDAGRKLDDFISRAGELPLVIRGFGADAGLIDGMPVPPEMAKPERRWSAAILAVAVSLCLLAFALWPKTKPGPQPPVTRMAHATREQLQSVLRDVGIDQRDVQSESADVDALGVIVVEVASELEKRTGELREGMAKYSRQEIADSPVACDDLHRVLNGRNDDWRKPPKFSTPALVTPRQPYDDVAINRAIRACQKYVKVRKQLDEATKKESRSRDFREAVEALREISN